MTPTACTVVDLRFITEDMGVWHGPRRILGLEELSPNSGANQVHPFAGRGLTDPCHSGRLPQSCNHVCIITYPDSSHSHSSTPKMVPILHPAGPRCHQGHPCPRKSQSKHRKARGRLYGPRSPSVMVMPRPSPSPMLHPLPSRLLPCL